MTSPQPEDDESEEHLVIHVDAGAQSDEPAIEPLASLERTPSLYQRLRYWLVPLALVVFLSAGAYVAGELAYQPESRLPVLNFDAGDPLYGTNAAVQAELDIVRETFAGPEALDLEATGRVFRLSLPRTLADRLFGERDESATVFSARGPAGDFRFLVLAGDGGPPILAIEAPLGLSASDQPTGVFIALNPADPVMASLVHEIEALLPGLESLPAVELDPDSVYVFGPYQQGDGEALQRRIETNTVMSYLAQEIATADGDVSMAAPVFLVAGGPSRGTINAVYHPARRVILEPLWGESGTASLAHELVHAYIDAVVQDEEALLSDAASYLERTHPVLHGEVVSDLYERLDREGRAEESLAFIIGAMAAQQTKTVATQRLLENPGNLAISEAILNSDAGFLAQRRLLPSCMFPNEGATGEITQDYYEMVAKACAGD